MSELRTTMENVDFKLLRAQKEMLMDITEEMVLLTEKGKELAEGLISLLDSLQDATVADNIKSEKEVFEN